jgi:hypothetical protein
MTNQLDVLHKRAQAAENKYQAELKRQNATKFQKAVDEGALTQHPWVLSYTQLEGKDRTHSVLSRAFPHDWHEHIDLPWGEINYSDGDIYLHFNEKADVFAFIRKYKVFIDERSLKDQIKHLQEGLLEATEELKRIQELNLKTGRRE